MKSVILGSSLIPLIRHQGAFLDKERHPIGDWRKGADSTATLTYALTTSGTTLLGLEGRLFFMKKGGYESPVGLSIPFLGRRSTNLHLNHFLNLFKPLQE